MKYVWIFAVLATVACQATDNAANAATPEELVFLYEEEKLARDLYDHFEAVYGITPYVHISESEQSHFESMESLLLNAGILKENEVIRTEPGIFINEELQALYHEFKAKGDASLIEALKVSAYIEEHDISGLKSVAERSDSEEVREMMTYLLEASKNHLRAFNRNLENRGVNYEPALLNTEEFNNIIQANGSCCQGSPGQGTGAGKGCCSKK